VEGVQVQGRCESRALGALATSRYLRELLDSTLAVKLQNDDPRQTSNHQRRQPTTPSNRQNAGGRSQTVSYSSFQAGCRDLATLPSSRHPAVFLDEPSADLSSFHLVT
jgi:hypothetical protein